MGVKGLVIGLTAPSIPTGILALRQDPPEHLCAVGKTKSACPVVCALTPQMVLLDP